MPVAIPRPLPPLGKGKSKLSTTADEVGRLIAQHLS